MSDQPTALRLADELAAELVRTVSVDMLHHNAAAELRRLHAETKAQAARIEADEALMRQALRELHDVKRHHAYTQGVPVAITALRERLGEKP